MKTKLAIILLHLAANSADAYFTHRNAMPAFNNPQHYQFREYNTIARPFVTRGTGPLVGYFAVASAAELATAYELDKHHHRKLAIGWEAFTIGSHAAGAAMNATHPSIPCPNLCGGQQ